MEFSPHLNSQSNPKSAAQAPQPAEPLGGVLPSVGPYHAPDHASAPSDAVVTKDGMLHIGAFTLSLDAMTRSLGMIAKMCKRIPDTFPTESALCNVLPDGNIPVPASSLPFSEAFEGFKRAMAGTVRDIDFLRCQRKLEGLSVDKGLSREELLDIRGLLIEGARIATTCTGIDDGFERALSYRSMLQRGRDWIVDRAGSANLFDPRIQNKLQVMPFEAFNPQSLRIGVDLLAQRIELRDDGSPVVRDVCKVEYAAAELLEQGVLSRTTTLSRGGIDAHVCVSSEHRRLFSGTSRVNDVFSALQLGQSASRLISSLTSQSVDLVRLCKFVDRSSATGLQVCLEALPTQAHIRLSDVDEWAPCFEAEPRKALSDNERHDLGALLLDAEVCLFIVGHLRAVCSGKENEAFWRRLWSVGIKDLDVRAARDLVNDAPALFSCDCAGAQSVVSSAAMMLGFTGEDRSGAGWRVPENSVASLAWAMTQ